MKKVLLSAVGLYAVVSLTVFAAQRQLLFGPSVQRVLPADIGLVGVDEVTLQTASGQNLYSWYGRAKSGQPTILFFHGNGGAVSHRRGKISRLMAKGFGVFVLGYPGYGGSDGSPSESSFRDASEIAYDYLGKSGIAANDIVIYGKSLGSAVAVQLAAQKQARALILESPMSSVLDIAKMQYPYLPVNLLLRDPFLSIDHIDRIRMPLLVIHGDNDAVIPIESGRMLFDKANEPKIFEAIDGAGHNNLHRYPVVDIVRSFIDAHSA